MASPIEARSRFTIPSREGLPPAPRDELDLAVGQVKTGSNLEGGIPQLEGGRSGGTSQTRDTITRCWRTHTSSRGEPKTRAGPMSKHLHANPGWDRRLRG